MHAYRYFRHRGYLALAICAVAFSSASSARAQPKASPTAPPKSAPAPAPTHDAIKDTVSDLFDRGVKAMDEQRWEDCRASFLAAWNIHRNYQVAGNLALCESKLGRNAEAAEHAAFFLHEMPPTAPADRKASAEALFKEIRPKVAELSIRVNKPGAELFLDGRSLGHAPLAASVFVEPGDRKVETRFGDAIARSTVSAKGGGTHEVALTFEEAKPPQGWKPPLPLVLASGGLALVGLGAGVGLTVAANGKANEAAAAAIPGGRSVCYAPTDAQKDACAALASKWREQGAFSNGAVGAFIAGGVLAAATVGLIVWQRSGNDSVQVRADVAASSGGISVSGRW
jgi:hypothetical protein